MRKHEKNEQLKMIIVEEQKGCSEDESFFQIVGKGLQRSNSVHFLACY